MDAELPVRRKHRAKGFRCLIDRLPKAYEFAFPLVGVCAKKGGAGAREVVDHVDNAKAGALISKLLPQVVAEVLPFVMVDLDALDELLVAEQARICVSNRVDPGTIAQAHEQGLPAQAIDVRARRRIGQYAIGRHRSFLRDRPNQAVANYPRVELLDKALQLTRPDVHERLPHESVGRFALVRRELLQPSSEAFDEAHAGLKVSIAVIL